jgi:hypothetical protein
MISDAGRPPRLPDSFSDRLVMAIQCEWCGRQYDVTLFQFEHAIRCDCGALISAGQPQRSLTLKARVNKELEASRTRPTHRIDSTSFGLIVIDGKKYDRDVIILPDSVDSTWWRREGHSLYPEDLGKALASRPEVLVVGCGQMGVLKVPSDTIEWVRRQGIDIICESTSKACDTYNRLVAEGRDAVACIHLTC